MTDIAEMAGYQSVSAFSLALKRETGVSDSLCSVSSGGDLKAVGHAKFRTKC